MIKFKTSKIKFIYNTVEQEAELFVDIDLVEISFNDTVFSFNKKELLKQINAVNG